MRRTALHATPADFRTIRITRVLDPIAITSGALLLLVVGFIVGVQVAPHITPKAQVVPVVERIDVPQPIQAPAAEAEFERGFAAGIEHEAWFCQNTDPELDGRLTDVPQ